MARGQMSLERLWQYVNAVREGGIGKACADFSCTPQTVRRRIREAACQQDDQTLCESAAEAKAKLGIIEEPNHGNPSGKGKWHLIPIAEELQENVQIIPDPAGHVEAEDKTPPKKKVDMAEFVSLVLRQREMYNTLDPRQPEVWKEIPTDRNILIGFPGDIHGDNRNCDLGLLIKHFEMTKREPLIYLGFLGDTLSNFHAKYIDGIHERDVTTEGGRMIVKYLFRQVADRWLFMGHGDHELHEMEAAGWNFIHELQKFFPYTSYIGNMAVVHVKVGNQTYHIGAAHRMHGYSMWNALHPHVRWLKDHRGDFDVVVGAHQHRKGTQEISHDGRKVDFIQTAPYIKTDAFARKLSHDEKTRESMAMGCVLLSGSVKRHLVFYNFEDGVNMLKALNAYEYSEGKVWNPEEMDAYKILEEWGTAAMGDEKHTI